MVAIVSPVIFDEKLRGALGRLRQHLACNESAKGEFSLRTGQDGGTVWCRGLNDLPLAGTSQNSLSRGSAYRGSVRVRILDADSSQTLTVVPR